MFLLGYILPHQFSQNKEAAILSVHLVLIWRHPSSAQAEVEICRIDHGHNYSVLACSLVFYAIKLVLEFEWFSATAEDFKKEKLELVLKIITIQGVAFCDKL